MKNLLNSTVITLSALVIASCGGGGGGSSGGGAGVVPPPPPPPPSGDTQAPTVSFSPATLTVGSEETGQSTLSATDDTAVTSGPTVTCTNGGSFADGVFTAPRTGLNITSVCTATAGDAAGNSGSGTLTVTVNQAPASGDVTLSGKLTFDLVPFNTSTNGLNYNAITQTPARGITVEAVNASGGVISTTATDAAGDYSFTLSPNTNLRIRAKAEMLQSTGAEWDVRVIDNTSSNALYTLAGGLTEIGTLDQTRNLNAGSGWGGSSYTGTRAAAPFAILNPIYDALQQIVAIDPDVVFPPATFNWSTRNRAANGSIANGEIGTSSYIGNGRLLILGDANQDTDEYDTHVVVHEWGHYFEDQLSRSDSIGGPHSGGQELDMRVAMGEGFGNALSGMITGDPFYRDSSGNQQGAGFAINVESNDPAGWYDESTVQSVLYDIFDADSDGDDTLSLGLEAIYNTLTASTYRQQPLFTSIFSFLAELKVQESGSTADIDTFAAARGINSTSADGVGETNRGSIVSALPVYKQVSVNGPAVEVCSVNDAGEFNKLGNRAFVSFTATAASHTLTMTRTSGAASRDPDFIVYKDGAVVGRAESAPGETDTVSITLAAGEHVVEAYDFFNLGQGGSGTPGDACYNFTVSR